MVWFVSTAPAAAEFRTSGYPYSCGGQVQLLEQLVGPEAAGHPQAKIRLGDGEGERGPTLQPWCVAAADCESEPLARNFRRQRHVLGAQQLQCRRQGAELLSHLPPQQQLGRGHVVASLGGGE